MTEIAIPDDAATIELLDQAEQALARVEDIDDAELLFRKLKAVDKAARSAQVSRATRLRAGKLHLRSERRWGESLAPARLVGTQLEHLKNFQMLNTRCGSSPETSLSMFGKTSLTVI